MWVVVVVKVRVSQGHPSTSQQHRSKLASWTTSPTRMNHQHFKSPNYRLLPTYWREGRVRDTGRGGHRLSIPLHVPHKVEDKTPRCRHHSSEILSGFIIWLAQIHERRSMAVSSQLGDPTIHHPTCQPASMGAPLQTVPATPAVLTSGLFIYIPAHSRHVLSANRHSSKPDQGHRHTSAPLKRQRGRRGMDQFMLDHVQACEGTAGLHYLEWLLWVGFVGFVVCYRKQVHLAWKKQWLTLTADHRPTESRKKVSRLQASHLIDAECGHPSLTLWASEFILKRQFIEIGYELHEDDEGSNSYGTRAYVPRNIEPQGAISRCLLGHVGN